MKNLEIEIRVPLSIAIALGSSVQKLEGGEKEKKLEKGIAIIRVGTCLCIWPKCCCHSFESIELS